MSEELKPCPFCECKEIGDKEWMDGCYVTQCLSCCATAQDRTYWNKRPAEDKLKEEIKSLKREVNLGIDFLHDATISRDLKIDKLRAEVERLREDFNKGYVLACANIISLHDEPTVAKDVLKELGKINWSEIAEYDKNILSEFIPNQSAEPAKELECHQ